MVNVAPCLNFQPRVTCARAGTTTALSRTMKLSAQRLDIGKSPFGSCECRAGYEAHESGFFIADRRFHRLSYVEIPVKVRAHLERDQWCKTWQSGQAEAMMLGNLAHPNIVPVFSVGEEKRSGLTAVCMPYLGSATLKDVFDRVFATTSPAARAGAILGAVRDSVLPGETAQGRHPPARLLENGTYEEGVYDLGAQLTAAVAFLHEERVYHLDLKPSNVLVSPDGTPFLLDFNLSHDGRSNPHLVGGTPLYMSPEQVRACLGGADSTWKQAPSDVYSLGLLLYQ